MSERDKQNHKAMNEGSPPHEFEPGEVTMHDADLTIGGAITVTQAGRPSNFVRGTFWRAVQWDSTVRTPDVHPIAVSEQAPNYDTTHVGSELELFAWNPKRQDLHPIMQAGSAITEELKNGSGNGFHTQVKSADEDPEHLNFSDELMRGQIEINFKHSTSGEEHALSQLKALRRLTKVAQNNDTLIVPISTLPHKPLERQDVNPNPYVLRIALEHMKWENVRHFTGSSFQTHSEISHSEIALRSINYLQQLTPGILAISASSPFLNGRVELNNEDIAGIDTTPSIWQSTRYPGRFEGSPSGGVIIRPAPETLEEFFEFAHDDLRANTSPTVARTLGHHADFRFRPDIGNHGTVEGAVADSFGGHPKKIAAMTALFRAQAVKIQTMLYEGREDELPETLFGKLDTDRLDQLHADSYAVSKSGIKAQISTPYGDVTTAGDQFEAMLNWVNGPEPTSNYPGLPDGVVDELRRSAKVVSEETFDQFDPSNDMFLSGFYQTGIGTLSQWLHRRAQHLRDVKGQGETEAIKNCVTELGVAYHTYVQLEGLEKELRKMFE